MYHLQPDDEVDGGVEEVLLLLKDGADGEAYLRRVYLALCDQGMISANKLSGFFGCHQQCLYGCVCFCLLVFAMYHGGDRANMSSIDRVNHIVLSGGCAKVIDGQELGLMEHLLLNSVGEVPSTKPIVSSIFDLMNTKNLSGGMIGPGNCQWFHNIVLRLTDGVGEDTQKLMKNHAMIHNACGFMLTHTNIGLSYVFGLFPHAIMNASSAGVSRSSLVCWLVLISAFGQLSGVVATYYLMKQLRAPFLNTYNDQDRKEHCVKDVNFITITTTMSTNGGSRSSLV